MEEVTGETYFPTDEQAWRDGAPQSYVLPYRGGEVVFSTGPDEGTWEVAAYNSKGDLLWAASTAIWNSVTFGQAREEARAVVRYEDE